MREISENGDDCRSFQWFIKWWFNDLKTKWLIWWFNGLLTFFSDGDL